MDALAYAELYKNLGDSFFNKEDYERAEISYRFSKVFYEDVKDTAKIQSINKLIARAQVLNPNGQKNIDNLIGESKTG